MEKLVNLIHEKYGDDFKIFHQLHAPILSFLGYSSPRSLNRTRSIFGTVPLLNMEFYIITYKFIFLSFCITIYGTFDLRTIAMSTNINDGLVCKSDACKEIGNNLIVYKKLNNKYIINILIIY